MAMTLEELKKGMSDKVFSQIVDIFLRQSTVLQSLTFDDCVSASGGGSTMKYKYLRKKDKAGNIVAVFTYGKKPLRPLQKAFDKTKSKIIKRLGSILNQTFSE